MKLATIRERGSPFTIALPVRRGTGPLPGNTTRRSGVQRHPKMSGPVLAVTLPTEIAVSIGFSIREDSGSREIPGRILGHAYPGPRGGYPAQSCLAPRKSNQPQPFGLPRPISQGFNLVTGNRPAMHLTGQRADDQSSFYSCQ